MESCFQKKNVVFWEKVQAMVSDKDHEHLIKSIASQFRSINFKPDHVVITNHSLGHISSSLELDEVLSRLNLG